MIAMDAGRNRKMTLGEVIKAVRDTRNIRRQDMADKLGIADKVLAKYESGEKIPDKDIVLKIQNIAGVLIESVMNIDGKYTYRIMHIDGEPAKDLSENSQEPVKIRTGYCIYCGQAEMLDSYENEDQNILNAEATWNCNCEEAKAARRKKQQEQEEAENRLRRIDNAIFDIRNLIGEAGTTEVATILCNAVPDLIDGKLKKISISIDSRTSATLLITSQGKVQVERRVVNVDQAESE